MVPIEHRLFLEWKAFLHILFFVTPDTTTCTVAKDVVHWTIIDKFGLLKCHSFDTIYKVSKNVNNASDKASDYWYLRRNKCG